MKVVDLPQEHEELYCKCLEDWSEEIQEAGDHKRKWYQGMRDKGLRVKLALDEAGRVGGMIQYLPAEHSFLEGKDLYFIPCIWVHGHKKGRGDFQGKGMGKTLLAAAEEDARARGAKGMAAWGVMGPFWMRASWFRKRGYSRADRNGIAVLLWKRFTEDAEPPRWIRGGEKPALVEGKVSVVALLNGWCPGQNMVYERARRAASEFGDKVVFQTIDTSERRALLEWGEADAVFIDGRKVTNGPPASFEKIRRLMAKRVRKLK